MTTKRPVAALSPLAGEEVVMQALDHVSDVAAGLRERDLRVQEYRRVPLDGCLVFDPLEATSRRVSL
jgi:hypothetical protein